MPAMAAAAVTAAAASTVVMATSCKSGSGAAAGASPVAPEAPVGGDCRASTKHSSLGGALMMIETILLQESESNLY